MHKFKVYKLHFTTPLHLGDERADYDNTLSVYHSDSMYAAITSVLAKVGVPVPDNGDWGFIISSLFPFYQKGNSSQTVYFLPKIKKQDDFAPEHRKKVKKVEWLDVKSFNEYINGENLFSTGFDEDLVKGTFFTSSDIDEGFISKEVNPRVTVSRDFSKDARPFYMERLYFKYNSGLYFMAVGEKFKTLEKALDILKEEGIGTDRTVGNGFFEWSSSELELQLPQSEYAANLSLFIPESKDETAEMLDDDHVAYNFQKRGGWITDEGLNTFRKNSIYMFSEGSVFRKLANEFEIAGKIVDLMPALDYDHLEKEKGIKKHPVWRSGKAIFIPVKI